MPESTVPEILRVNLTSSVLSLKCLGVDDVLAFEYLEAPKPEQIKASLRQAGEACDQGAEQAERAIDHLQQEKAVTGAAQAILDDGVTQATLNDGIITIRVETGIIHRLRLVADATVFMTARIKRASKCDPIAEDGPPKFLL